MALITYAHLLEQHASTMEQLCSDLELTLTTTPSCPDRNSHMVKGIDRPVSPNQWQELLDVCEQGLERIHSSPSD